MTAARITFAIGRSRYDAHPRNAAVAAFDEFENIATRLHAPSKTAAGYVACAFSDGHRCAASAMPTAWVGLDVDGIDPGILGDWRLWLCRYRGFGWATHSSTPEAPRERVILALSEPVNRHHRIGICRLLQQDIEDEFGTAVRLDPTAFRPEQPLFVRPSHVQPFRLLGEPLGVAAWLPQIADPPPPPPAATELQAEQSDARMRWIVGQVAALLTMPLANRAGYALRCPWSALHTTQDAPNSTATALMFPSAANGWRGGFSCMHSHCRHRTLRDVEALLQAATAAVEAA